MTVANAINYADKIRPNTFPTDVKLGWINDLEENIQLNVWLLQPGQLKQHMDTGEELLAEGRFSLYWSWLLAMIDFANGETSKYMNSMDIFNGYMDSYTKWYADNVQPGQERRYIV